MAAKKKQKLGVSLSASEMELLVGAARLAGSDDVSCWAKEVLLGAAGGLSVEGQERIDSAVDDKSSRFRPRCGCGATGNRNGECDGSCIMRF